MKIIDNTSIAEDIKTHLESKDGDSQRIFKFAGVGSAGGTILKSVKARKLTMSEKVNAEIWACKSSARPELASAEDVIADAISKGFEAKPGAWEGAVSVVRSRTPYTSWEVEVVGCGMSVRGHRPEVRRNVFELRLGGHDLISPDEVTLLASSDSEFEANIQESIKSWH